MMKGKFVTFEGCEGSGKSTQLKILSERLTKEGIKHIVTREPGGSAIAEKIRAIILDGGNTAMDDKCEALLYAAARAQHLAEKVAPLLAEGTLVLCDRFVDSSLAYQGYARGLGRQFIENINCFALEDFKPDATIFLDISPEAAFRRKHGADKNDRIEQLGLEFHNKVYQGYLSLCQNSDRIIKIDCGGNKAETAQKIYNALLQKGIF